MEPTTKPNRDALWVAVLSAIALYGVAASIAFDRIAGTTIKDFPEPWGRAFVALYGLSALVALMGIAKNAVGGVLIERIGMFGVGGLGGAYGLWSATGLGLRAFGFSVLVLAVALAAFVRIHQINREAKLSEVGAALVAENEGDG